MSARSIELVFLELTTFHRSGATVFEPLAAMRDEGTIVVSDFTTLVETWRTEHRGKAFLYQP